MEAGQKAEGGIEAGDERAGEGGSRAAAGGNLEFRDDPACVRSQMGNQPPDEGLSLRFRQAVEEEMGCDEVVFTGGRRETARVGTDGPESTLCALLYGPIP